MSWEDQGRQAHGWFGHGHGLAPASPFSPDAIEQAAGFDLRKMVQFLRLIEKFWSGNKQLRPNAPAAPSESPPEPPLPRPATPGRPPASAPPIAGPPVQQLPPERLRFSQTTAGGEGGSERVRNYVQQHGTIETPVDAVRTPGGLVTIDNTRVAVAREKGLSSIPVRVSEPTDPIPPEFQKRFESLQTWGEVLSKRVQGQEPQLPPTGTTDIPLLRGGSPR